MAAILKSVSAAAAKAMAGTSAAATTAAAVKTPWYARLPVIGTMIAGAVGGTVAVGQGGIQIGGAIDGPSGPAGKINENVKQTEAFASGTTGVRAMFVGLFECLKIIGDLLSGKLSFKDMMSGKRDIKGALSSAENRADDVKTTGLTDIPGKALDLAASNPATTVVATLGTAASALALRSASAGDAPKVAARGGAFNPANWGSRGKTIAAVVAGVTALVAGSSLLKAEEAPKVPEGASVPSVDGKVAFAAAAENSTVNILKDLALRTADEATFNLGTNIKNGDITASVESVARTGADFASFGVGFAAGASISTPWAAAISPMTGPLAPVTAAVITGGTGLVTGLASSGAVGYAWNGLKSVFTRKAEGETAPAIAAQTTHRMSDPHLGLHVGAPA